ncbi:MAG: site-2 protease family protein [Bacteroidota bacterium]|nr:site-2 protease family protein [Bacteroidota bacterium]
MFNQAWHIGTFFKIPVKIHWTFGLIIMYVVFSSLSDGFTWQAIVVEVVFVLSLFFCVVLHEFGHALTAQRFNVETEDIILLPIGGVARLKNMPEKPIQELIIAIMGPVVNVIIALLIFTGLYIYYDFNYSFFTSITEIEFLNWSGFFPLLMTSNILLVVFNMIPAFPMDGGRVFRALLSMKFGRVKATRWASRLGQAICIVFIIVGIYYQAWTWVLIGFFIFVSASQEYQSVFIENQFKNIYIKDIYRKQFRLIPDHMNMQDAFTFVMQGIENSFIVINLSGQYIGSVSSRNIIKSFKKNPALKVSDIYFPQLVSLSPDAHISHALDTFKSGHSIIAIVDDDDLVGVLDQDGIEHYLKFVS